MATREEIIAGLQDVADRGMEDQLTDAGRELFDAAVRDGLITSSRGVIGKIAETISPRFQEDLPEVEPMLGIPADPTEAQQFIDSLSSGEGLVPRSDGMIGQYIGAKVTTDRYGTPIIETRSGERKYLNKPGVSVGDVPRVAEAVIGGVKEAAPYMAGGAVPGIVKGAITQGAIGLATEGIQQAGKSIRGEDVDVEAMVSTPIMAMAADVLGRGLFSIGSKIYSTITGRSAGKIAPNDLIDKNTGQFKTEAIDQMKASATDQDIDDLALRLLMDEAEKGNLTESQMQLFSKKMDEYLVSGQATPAQAERYNLFKSMKIDPTRAQVTRQASDFQTQQELAKTSGPVRTALEQQQVQMGRAFDTMEAGTGGVIRAETSPIQQAVIDKAVKLDQEIGALYKSADEMVKGAPAIDIQSYLKRLASFKRLNQRSSGTYKALVGQIEDQGYKIKKGKFIDGDKPVTPKQAEFIRQGINSLYDGANPVAKTMIREAKEALDMSVGRALGKDAYQQARQAYSNFRKGMSREQLSKFSRNEKSLIKDLLEERVPSEQVFERVITGRGYTAKDLRALKNYIVGNGKQVNPAGATAWADLRAETLRYIRENSFGGPIGELGERTLTRTRLQNVIRRIGDNKLKVIFTDKEVKFLNNMAKLAEIIEPVAGTAMGRGPSAQAISQLERAVAYYTGSVGAAVLNFGKMFLNAVTKSGAETSTLTPTGSIASTIGKEAAKKATESARLRPETIGRLGAIGTGSAVAISEE